MKNQRELILSNEWDCLIILDACRYDYFEAIYRKYIDGKLKKVISPASETYEWCSKVFKKGDFSDVVYISANPYINSKIKIRDFHAKKCFSKIIDVWEFGWNKQLNTVPPENVNRATFMALRKYRKKRFIVHYLQPHAPYLSLAEAGFRQYSGFEWKDNVKTHFYKKVISSLLTRSLRVPFISKRFIFEARLCLGLEFNPLHFTFLKMGKQGLRQAYKDNVRCVLKPLSELGLLHSLGNKRVIVTSDHGEFLGEMEMYGHFPGCSHPILIEVPWLELSSTYLTSTPSYRKTRL